MKYLFVYEKKKTSITITRIDRIALVFLIKMRNGVLLRVKNDS